MADLSLPGYAGGGAVAGANALSLPAAEVREFARATTISSRGLVAELKMRERLLERRTKMLDKELEASNAKVDALRAERDAIEDSVDARLRSDAFAAQETSVFTMDRPEGFDTWSAEQQKAFYDAQWSVGQSLGYGQTQSPEDILRSDIAAGREMDKVLQQLIRKGIDEDVLAAMLAQDPNGDSLRAYAEGSRGDIATLNKLYNRRERVLSQASETGGSILRADIRDQVKVSQGIQTELRETRVELRQVGKRLEAATDRVAKAAGKDGPDRIIAGTNRKIANANRGRRT